MAFAVRDQYAYASRVPEIEILDAAKRGRSLGLSFGIPYTQDNFATRVRLLSDKPMVDVSPFNGANLVSQKFKDIIEEYEPGVHQFFPVEILKKNGEPHEVNYYTFNACQRFCAVLARESGADTRWSSVVAEPNEGEPWAGVYMYEDIVISMRKVGNRKVWCSNIIEPNTLFVTRDVGKRLIKERIRYIQIDEVKESDKEWIAEENIGPYLDWVRKTGWDYSKLEFGWKYEGEY